MTPKHAAGSPMTLGNMRPMSRELAAHKRAVAFRRRGLPVAHPSGSGPSRRILRGTGAVPMPTLLTYDKADRSRVGHHFNGGPQRPRDRPPSGRGASGV